MINVRLMFEFQYEIVNCGLFVRAKENDFMEVADALILLYCLRIELNRYHFFLIRLSSSAKYL